MLFTFTFWLLLLAGLVLFLGVSVALRHRAEEIKRRALERKIVTAPFDFSTIAPQIEKVRQDYLVAATRPPHQARYRAGLLGAARRIVSSFSFFRSDRLKTEV